MNGGLNFEFINFLVVFKENNFMISTFVGATCMKTIIILMDLDTPLGFLWVSRARILGSD